MLLPTVFAMLSGTITAETHAARMAAKPAVTQPVSNTKR
jgi:hypothetical protein